MQRTAIVVGAGITGVAAALNLVRDGWAVTLVDRLAPGDPGQTSYGNAGLLARGSVAPVQAPGLILRAPRMLLDPDGPLFLRPAYLPRLVPWLVPFLRNGAMARLERIVPAIFASPPAPTPTFSATARPSPGTPSLSASRPPRA